MGDTGFEHTSKSPEETHFPEEGGAESGALATADARLSFIVDAWGTLPEHIKAVLTELVKSQ